jgi:hypothetical protein
MRPIETIDKVVRTSRQMLRETSREPTSEELAEMTSIPLDKVREVLKITKEPILIRNHVARNALRWITLGTIHIIPYCNYLFFRLIVLPRKVRAGQIK